MKSVTKTNTIGLPGRTKSNFNRASLYLALLPFQLITTKEMYNYVTLNHKSIKLFYLVRWAYTRILATSMLMIIVSLYPIPKGKFLAPFLPFRTSYTNVYNVGSRLCAQFRWYYPEFVVFEGSIRTPVKFFWISENCWDTRWKSRNT